MKVLTRETYARRVERVAEYLVDHLDGDVDLHRLAEEAHLSPYHFHRVYHGMTGETVAETVRRMRLHRAAVGLISSNTDIAQLAREAGYASTAAFSRAFTRAYGMPPSTYRIRQVRFASAAALKRHLHRHPEENPIMNRVEIKQVPPVRVVALRHTGDYMSVGTAFEKLMIWCAGRGLDVNAARSFGIYYDDPAAVATEALQSDACIEVPADFSAEAPHRIIHTPSGRCAVLVHTGPYSDLEKSYQWLYGVWLPGSGHEPDDLPSFEEYLNDPRTVPPSELQTAICLPIK